MATKIDFTTESVLAIYETPTEEAYSVLYDPSLGLAQAVLRIREEVSVILNGERAHAFGLKTELCKNNGDAGTIPSRKVTIPNANYETASRLCLAEIDNLLCSTKTLNSVAELIYEAQAAVTRDNVLNYFFVYELRSLIQRGVKERNYSSMFGDTQFVAGSTTQGRRNGVAVTDANAPFFEKIIKKADGVYYSLLNSANSTAQFRPKFFDTNTGSAGDNMLNPANVMENLNSLMSKFTPAMKSRRREVIILLDPWIMHAIAMAYRASVTNGTPIGLVIQENFNNQTDTIDFLGYTLRPFAESEMYGEVEAKSMKTSDVPNVGKINHERNCRIFVSLKENIATTTSAASIGSAMLFSVKEDIRPLYEGNFIFAGMMNWGAGAMNEEQCIVGHATSDDFTV